MVMYTAQTMVHPNWFTQYMYEIWAFRTPSGLNLHHAVLFGTGGKKIKMFVGMAN